MSLSTLEMIRLREGYDGSGGACSVEYHLSGSLTHSGGMADIRNELYSDGFPVANIAKLLNRRRYRTRGEMKWTRTRAQRLLDDYESVYTKTSKLGGVIRDFILPIA